MRIPGGDLAPARRRRYGGSYSRRRRRRNLRLILAGLLLVVAGGAAYLLKKDDSAVPSRLAVAPSCTPAPSPVATAGSAPAARAPRPVVLPQPRQVRLVVLNGTSHDLLAKTIGDQLAALGFVVTRQANAPAALAGASKVTFGPGAGPAATVVAHWVLGAEAVGSARATPGSVQLVLGSSFRRLATPAEAAAAARVAPTAAPVPTARATPSPC